MVCGDSKIGSVIPLGFEPRAHSLEGCCSIQLSYGAFQIVGQYQNGTNMQKKCGEKGIRTPGGS